MGYWPLAFLGDESQWSAEAAECAGDQNKYWEYHDLLFNSQSGENRGAFSKDNLKKFAATLGLDTGTFNQCVDSGKYTDLIHQMTGMGSSMGVGSTPTFAINGKPMVGAQSFEAFQQVIEGQLNK